MAVGSGVGVGIGVGVAVGAGVGVGVGSDPHAVARAIKANAKAIAPSQRYLRIRACMIPAPFGDEFVGDDTVYFI